ncbi:hypothetical protein FTO74_11455 [Granulicella sp. WH15]|uniref:hypothetical protein n=1 Tax=Granulicella sp. WH15 TaxID=2602070 RepID=UPI0013677433|nr:hypothetical protein [Granulicella sp. WH15]QHN03916.1 hypothetical protein FTO74_11455 [Granulicella sp. WH15]
MIRIASTLMANASSAASGNSLPDALHPAHGLIGSEASNFAASLRGASNPLASELSSTTVSTLKHLFPALQPEPQGGKAEVSRTVMEAQVNSQQASASITTSSIRAEVVPPDKSQSLVEADLGKEVKVASSNTDRLNKHVSIATTSESAAGVSRVEPPKHETAKQIKHAEIAVAASKGNSAEPTIGEAATPAPALTGNKVSIDDPAGPLSPAGLLPQTQTVSKDFSRGQDKAHIARTEAGKSTQLSPTAISKKHVKVESARVVDAQAQVLPETAEAAVFQPVVSDFSGSRDIAVPRVVAEQDTVVAGHSVVTLSMPVGTVVLPGHDAHTLDQAKETQNQLVDSVDPAISASTSIAVPVASSSMVAIPSASITHAVVIPIPAIPQAAEERAEQVASKITNVPVSQAAAHDAASPLAYQPGAIPAHETLSATPNVLEVGVASGTHGWVRVRAELQPASGEVMASVVANSSASAESLHRQLPALTAYLASERLDVSSVVVHRSYSSQSTLDTNSSSSGSASQQGAADRHPRNGDTNSLSNSWNGSTSDQEGSNAGLTHGPQLVEANVSAGNWLSVRA